MKKAETKYRILSSCVDIFVSFVAIFLILFLSKNLQLIVEFFQVDTVEISSFDYYNIFSCSVLILLYVSTYYCVIPFLKGGQTLGMYIFKVKFVNYETNKLDFSSLFVREVLVRFFLPLCTVGLSLLLDLIILFYRKDKQSIADLMTKIVIVDKLDY